MTSGIVMIGHGTKDAEGVAEFLGYVQGIRERFGGVVEGGVLEYPTPELPTVQCAFDRVLSQGVDDVIALPLFLFFAGHTQGDLPEQLAEAQARYPDVPIMLAGPLGVDERLLEALEERLSGCDQDARTAVLLVGRGSLNSEANADLHKIARMLWDRNHYGWVEASFISVAPPGVPEGLERCVRLGASRVIVAPYFLNTGVLVKRITRQARHPKAEVVVVEHLGLHDNVFDVLWERVLQAQQGMCACQASIPCRIPGLRCPRSARCTPIVDLDGVFQALPDVISPPPQSDPTNFVAPRPNPKNPLLPQRERVR
ncbi:MAG: sirohydrochlorin chelatase [Chloroflexota bacterium]|nr:sirohydrochlorin chelatase [Chloroflexota bacterium]